jgi:two-component sensor histidine kinase
MARTEPFALILAPAGRDAEVAAAILREVGIAATICADLASLVALLPGGGCAVVTEEALLISNRRDLAAWISRQPPWSDFPFVLLTCRGSSPDARLLDLLGNVTVLERPFHPAVLANAVKSALRARARQREVEVHQENQALLIAELNHRVKNTLATVQSLAHQTSRQAASPEAARERFEARLMSLSRTHNLLNQTSWTGAALKEVLAPELEPYAGGSRDRVVIAGFDLDLTAPMALAIGMIIHELATNAAKYGALSRADGRVEITWSLAQENGSARVLRFRWAEASGPDVAAPSRLGFGSRLIEQTVRGQLNGTVDMRFERSGLVCEFEIPLDHQELLQAQAAE